MEDEELDAVVEEVEANVIDVELEEIEAPEESTVFSVSDTPAAIATSSEVFTSRKSKEKEAKPLKSLKNLHISKNDVKTSGEDEVVEIELADFGSKNAGKRKWKYSKFKGADDPDEVGEIAPNQTLDDIEMETISPV